MCRAAFTLLFTTMTLLGPGVCCCSFAASAHPNPVSTGGDRSAAKPVKSCCQPHVPPGGDRGERQPGQPAKCPCDHGKQVASLPPDASTTADLAARLQLLDTFVVGLLLRVEHVASTITSADPPKFEPVSGLAGRDLLAAFCTLRC